MYIYIYGFTFYKHYINVYGHREIEIHHMTCYGYYAQYPIPSVL